MEGGVVSERMAQQWPQRFNAGEENTKDLPYSGRPKSWNIDNIHRVLEENPQKSTQRLSEKHDSSKDTIHRQIKTLRKSYRHCRSVPQELTLQQAQHRVYYLVFSLSELPWMINLSGKLSHVMKNGSITATFMS